MEVVSLKLNNSVQQSFILFVPNTTIQLKQIRSKIINLNPNIKTPVHNTKYITQLNLNKLSLQTMFNQDYFELQVFNKTTTNEEYVGSCKVQFSRLLNAELVKLQNSIKRVTNIATKIIDKDDNYKGDIEVRLSLEDLG